MNTAAYCEHSDLGLNREENYIDEEVVELNRCTIKLHWNHDSAESCYIRRSSNQICKHWTYYVCSIQLANSYAAGLVVGLRSLLYELVA